MSNATVLLKHLLFPAAILTPTPTIQATLFVVNGSCIASCLLLFLLVVYNLSFSSFSLTELHIAALFTAAITYFSFARYLIAHDRSQYAQWLIFAFYTTLTCVTLFLWGINSPHGMLAAGFAVILSGVLIGSKAILPATAATITLLFAVQLIHAHTLAPPPFSQALAPSTYWDVAAYATIISIFALVAWVSGMLRERNLQRALQAEEKLLVQKEQLRQELEKESAALHQAQLAQLHELHRFAVLGQSAAATLHELSNRLCALTLDIDDLQQGASIKTIRSTKESLAHINALVSHTKSQLTSYTQESDFSITHALQQSCRDVHLKSLHHHAKITLRLPNKHLPRLHGSPMALVHIISILLNNALDACQSTHHPKISIVVSKTSQEIHILVADNGKGIDPSIAHRIFEPAISTKSSGMGVGLFIAKHLAEHQFGGTLRVVPCNKGAQFRLDLPLVHHKQEPIDIGALV